MGRSHAKTNTTQANLTYYERSLLRKETAAKRIGGDSFKPLDHCYLCLSRLNDPVSCTHGHLYCKMCVISDLISQKASIETAKRDLAVWEAKEQQEREETRLRARDRVIKDFERGMGLSGGRISIGKSKEDQNTSTGGTNGLGGKKEMEDLAKEAEERAIKALEAEQVESRKQKLAAFWLPSLAPEGRLQPVKDVKLETVCQAGKHPHPMSRKTLLPVILTYPTPKATTPTCPSCSKEISNSSSSVLLSSRKPLNPPSETVNGNVPGDADDGPPAKKKKKGKKEEDPYVCGHVVCKTCAETIVKPSGRCCICEAEVDDAGRIPVNKEGTGFAAAGGAEAKPDRIAFRV